jgi:serine protease Do
MIMAVLALISPVWAQTPAPGQGFLGAKFSDVNEDQMAELGLESLDGILVLEVIAGGPAEAAGLKPNDVIVQMDDKKVTDVEDLRDKMKTTKPGDAMVLHVIRNKTKQELKATLGTRPPTTAPARPQPPN